MSKSVKRVERAAIEAGLAISVQRMPGSTRTAAEAAAACGCNVSQIVKSMIFAGADTGRLRLVLINGADDMDPGAAKALFGESLIRADPGRVRTETGFAIGGVSPIGHLTPTETWMDARLLRHDAVWAAAGAPNAVFCVSPGDLLRATGATLFENA